MSWRVTFFGGCRSVPEVMREGEEGVEEEKVISSGAFQVRVELVCECLLTSLRAPFVLPWLRAGRGLCTNTCKRSSHSESCIDQTSLALSLSLQLVILPFSDRGRTIEKAATSLRGFLIFPLYCFYYSTVLMVSQPARTATTRRNTTKAPCHPSYPNQFTLQRLVFSLRYTAHVITPSTFHASIAYTTKPIRTTGSKRARTPWP